MTLEELDKGLSVEFTMYGSVNNRTKISGLIIASSFGRYEERQSEIQANHTNIYQILPEEVQITVPEDFRDIETLTVILTTGERVVIGKPWIIEDTIAELVSNQIVITCDITDPAKLNESDIAIVLGNLPLKVTSIEKK